MNWFIDRIGLKPLFYSLLLHVLVLLILYPVIFLPSYPVFDSRLVFLGTSTASSHYPPICRANDEDYIDRILSRPRLILSSLKEIYEKRLGERILPPYVVSRQDSTFVQSKISQNSKRRDVFSKGITYCFPDGKKYHFEPEYLHYNLYEELVILRRMEQGYVLDKEKGLGD